MADVSTENGVIVRLLSSLWAVLSVKDNRFMSSSPGKSIGRTGLEPVPVTEPKTFLTFPGFSVAFLITDLALVTPLSDRAWMHAAREPLIRCSRRECRQATFRSWWSRASCIFCSQYYCCPCHCRLHARQRSRHWFFPSTASPNKTNVQRLVSVSLMKTSKPKQTANLTLPLIASNMCS